VADIITLNLNPEQFAAAQTKLATAPGVTFDATADGGTVKTSQIEFTYSYDGKSVLRLTITAKHGLVKFAGDDVIKEHLQQLLAQA
jgi:hypothetical protein